MAEPMPDIWIVTCVTYSGRPCGWRFNGEENARAFYDGLRAGLHEGVMKFDEESSRFGGGTVVEAETMSGPVAVAAGGLVYVYLTRLEDEIWAGKVNEDVDRELRQKYDHGGQTIGFTQ